MKQYSLKIKSKNEKSLKYFLLFFFKHLKTKFNTIQKQSTAKINRKVITFLKSPHVNKTAQEHFEMHFFTRKILLKGYSLEKALIFSKKVLTRLFQDISINLELLTDKQVSKKSSLLLFNPNNNKLSKKNFFKTNLKRYKQKIKFENFIHKQSSLTSFRNFLNTMSIFGEILVIFSKKK
jgi:ribosomal protein S10